LEINAINFTTPEIIGIKDIILDNLLFCLLVTMYDRDKQTEINKISNNDQIPVFIKLRVKGFTSTHLPVESPVNVVISSPRTPVINIIELVFILVK
jgi:hypothetical protein